jgi:UDP-N-acetyl-2-amino-2-deoxyglucuronate dehydrogenase
MDKLRTAVIGYGKVAHIHAEALASIPESEFVAVCGRDAGKARAFGEQYRVKAFTRVEEMVGAGVRAVVVATPHPAHASVTTAALRAGAHAIVEKPLASSLEDCDAMIAAAREGGRTLAMISQRRLYAPVQRVRQAIDAGKIGRPVLGTVAMLGWRSEEYYRSDPWRGSWDGEGGGVLVNQAPHQIDILQWFMGDVDELYGAWANVNHPYIESRTPRSPSFASRAARSATSSRATPRTRGSSGECGCTARTGRRWGCRRTAGRCSSPG